MKSRNLLYPSFKNLFSLKGKNAIVTGGVGILGKYFCAGLAECGANVIVLDLDEKKTAAFSDELERTYKVRTFGLACDVTSPVKIRKAMAQILEKFQEIHILHNNAGGKSGNLDAYFESFEKYSYEEWKTVSAINIDGMFLMAQAVGKHMIEHGKGGSIIQTSSIYGIMAPDQRIYEGSRYLDRPINTPAVYSATKAAVIGLTKYLSTYWSGRGIRVNSITPGGVESGQNETFKRRYSSRIPLGRMAFAHEMVGALIYLASDASSYVTGHNLVVDGGLSAW